MVVVDLSPYSEELGGYVLNTTINMYVYCVIVPSLSQKIRFCATDLVHQEEIQSQSQLPVGGKLPLHRGVYNRIIAEFHDDRPLSFQMYTYSDAPPGSGLGSSSTMVVCMIKAYVEWLNLPLGDYDIANLAYSIERNDLQMQGDKQDQYAATFGGMNFMEFSKGNRVIVNPLCIKDWILNELQHCYCIILGNRVNLQKLLISKYETRRIKIQRASIQCTELSKLPKK